MMAHLREKQSVAILFNVNKRELQLSSLFDYRKSEYNSTYDYYFFMTEGNCIMEV